MKRVICVALLSVALTAYAEDIIQVNPLHTTAGVKYSQNKTIEINLVNSFNVANLQFDLLLPAGMAISANNSVFTERAQTFDEDEEEYVNNFTWTSNVVSSGYTRIVFTPTTLEPIEAGAGPILKIRYKTDAAMAAGIYPILMENIELDKSVTESLKGLQAVSYVVIGEESPLATEANLDLSAMTGYVPSFVVEKLNEDVATNTNLVSLNLSGATALGAALQVPENSLWYTATQAGLNRTFPANQWSTVCLPFALSSEQVDAVKASGVEIEQLSSYEGNTVMFEYAAEMEANNAYIVRSATAQAPFASLSDVSVDELSPVAVTKDGLTMTGVYEQTVLNSDANTLYYIFNSTDGKFSRVGTNVSVPPFRAYLQRPLDGESARNLDVIHDDGSTTGIMELPSDKDGANQIVNRKSVNGEWFDLQGRRLSSNVVKGGIRVMQGKKYLDY